MELKKLSISPVNTFKACPRKFYYEYVQGYEIAVKPKHLFIGDAYDKLLGRNDTDGAEATLIYAAELLSGKDLIDFEYIFMHHYVPFYEQQKHKAVAGGNQYGFGEPAYEGADWKITGYLDRLVTKDIHGSDEYVVEERKTTKDAIEEHSEYWKRLALDPQIRSYVWAVKSKGLKAGWVHYVAVRKITTKVWPSMDKSLSDDDYRDKLYAWGAKNRKILVASKDFYVSEAMVTEFAEEHIMCRGMILDTDAAQEKLKEAGFNPESAWIKHEKSCDDYGGCPFLGVCQHHIGLDNAMYSQTHKVLK